ncbi:unnamed protein product [Ambrosiozyma monospora]|uniref:Unnamed protein product n=1 Tax=Ambrosiozyma monospora TaxID=43982 RepID=A0ACB5TI64_AMBMO|nr:unnamed protein product [Ambrosiozyma monospora]
MKNFSSMTAIISGLSSTSISRLKKTWELLPKTVLLNFHKMDNLMSIGKNYSEYRNMLRFIDEEDEPSLPFLGMFLSDLRFLTDGNPDYLHNNRSIINYNKRMNLTKTINDILKFSQHAYNFREVKEIKKYLAEVWANLQDDEALYEMSLKLEPRVSLLPAKSKRGKSVSGHGHGHGHGSSSSAGTGGVGAAAGNSYVHPLSANEVTSSSGTAAAGGSLTATALGAARKRFNTRAAYSISGGGL